MDAAQLSEFVDEFNYILGKISKYQKNNQYVYLRAFDSWMGSYNAAVERLNADKTLTVPLFKLRPDDYSPTGKSINKASVVKFIKSINHQVLRLEEKIDELHEAAALQLAVPHPLTVFFTRDNEGQPLDPPADEQRVVVVVPATAEGRLLFHQGIQPVLESQGFSCFNLECSMLDDVGLSELCREPYACRLAIFDLCGQSAKVMLALGLAYGIGKPVIMLHPQHEAPLGTLQNIDTLGYGDNADIKSMLTLSLQSNFRD
ncbi:MAG: hypothetical protein L3J63_01285 [Geopsychrobacter sp.]|nr:hypothetical protein [Geopsychrobacter sp.]